MSQPSTLTILPLGILTEYPSYWNNKFQWCLIEFYGFFSFSFSWYFSSSFSYNPGNMDFGCVHRTFHIRMRISEAILVFFFSVILSLFFELSVDFVFSRRWTLSLASLLKRKRPHSYDDQKLEEDFLLLLTHFITPFSWNNIRIVYLQRSVQYFFYVYYVCIKYFYTGNWDYLVFPFVYLVLP